MQHVFPGVNTLTARSLLSPVTVTTATLELFTLWTALPSNIAPGARTTGRVCCASITSRTACNTLGAAQRVCALSWPGAIHNGGSRDVGAGCGSSSNREQ
jgi:hypothetical protein